MNSKQRRKARRLSERIEAAKAITSISDWCAFSPTEPAAMPQKAYWSNGIGCCTRKSAYDLPTREPMGHAPALLPFPWDSHLLLLGSGVAA